MGFVLFLFLYGQGSGTAPAVATATFKNQEACEQALVTAIESADGAVNGFCTPTKVKTPR